MKVGEGKFSKNSGACSKAHTHEDWTCNNTTSHSDLFTIIQNLLLKHKVKNEKKTSSRSPLESHWSVINGLLIFFWWNKKDKVLFTGYVICKDDKDS